MSFHRDASLLHCLHVPKCAFNKNLGEEEVSAWNAPATWSWRWLKSAYPPCDICVKCTHSGNIMWGNRCLTSSVTSQSLGLKVCLNTKLFSKKNEEDQDKECIMLQRLCTVNSGNTVRNSKQTILITEYCASCFLCSAQLSLLHAAANLAKILLLSVYNYYKITN